MLLETPRIVVAGLAGDSGKTLVSLGLGRALVERGLRVASFKKGPDFIDAGWLSAATGRPARNLDTFLMPPGGIGEAVARSLPADLVLVEGNRGLYDGMDAAGTHSTAELAVLLGAPVLLVVDVTKTTRTVAALVRGCQVLDPRVRIGGVLLNRVGTPRQERVIREALEAAGAPPVVGALPRVRGEDPLPGRHLGLVTAAESRGGRETVERAAALVAGHVDLDAVLALARTAGHVELPGWTAPSPGRPVRIAVFRDETFSFFYPENLEALEAGGAELLFLSPRQDRPLPPDLDGVYIGGGFPELAVRDLSLASELRVSMGRACARGLPVFAECGGLMLLARELIVEGTAWPMLGVLDLVVEHTSRPQGHGYVAATADRPNPFFPVGLELRGHEFHYSRVIGGGDAGATVMALARGTGVVERRDGVVRGNVWASYTHFHALGTPEWAAGFLQAAASWRNDGPGTAVAWA